MTRRVRGLGLGLLAVVSACSKPSSDARARSAAESTTVLMDSNAGFVDRLSDINRSPLASTELGLSILVDWIAHYKSRRGHLPTRIEEILPPDPSDPNFLPHDRWWRDAWDQRIEYQVSGGTCELRSAGPDGHFGTRDDVVRRCP